MNDIYDASKTIDVRHTVRDGKHHIGIYLPGDKYTWREAKWPVTPEADSVDAIWNGFDEAKQWCGVFGFEAISTTSTDREAFAEFSRQCDEMTTKGSAKDGVQSDIDRAATDAKTTGDVD